MMTVEQKILAAVDEIGDPLMEHILDGVDEQEEIVKSVVTKLVRDGVLHQKEDAIDHDWSYRRARPLGAS